MASVVLFAGCKKDDYVAIPGKCPVIIATSPADGATGVSLNQVITATFNEKMKAATITQASFTVTGASNITGSLVYDEPSATVSFTPASPLTANTTYTGKISRSVQDMMGNALQNDFIWTFSTGATLAPVVISTDPVNNATGVFLNKIVSAGFNAPMDGATINSTTFTLKQGITAIPGTVSYTGTTAYFTPTAALASNTIYIARISTGVKNPSGVSLVNDYTWTFTTGTISGPMIISTDPTNNAKGVNLNKLVLVNFNMAMDATTINATTFSMKQGGNAVAGAVTYSGTTATFTPAADLLPGVNYVATITNGTKNTSGVALANTYTWTFSTQAGAPAILSTDPANNATNVVINKIVTANFNMAMDPLTITSTTFTVKQGSNPISGTVSYTGTTASFTPAINFLPGTQYTATITTAAKNTTGTGLANNYTWNFTTGITVAPTVISTDPANKATGVLLNKKITASFSMAMDPLSITSATYTLKQGITSVSGVVSYSGTTATFTPSANLLAGAIYTATITTGAKNVAGTPLANNYVWTFTAASAAPTVTSTDPANKENGVALDKTVSASFSTTMDATTISSGTFTLKLGTTSVSGTVSYSGTKASFKPSANLLSDNTYTATITTGAKDASGTPLASDYVWTFSTKAHAGPIAPDLKSVERFGIIAGTGITNNAGFSVINDMDVGIYPGVRADITGFPPGKIVNGAIYASDDLLPAGVSAMLKQAKLDLTSAYLNAEGASSPAPATVSGDQGGKTLAPGIYKSTSTLGISSGDLTLDAKGDQNAVWIFQIASGFTTKGGSGGNVILINGAQAKNVIWQVGSSATIGDNTSFYGTILCYTSITMNSGATATGHMLTINAAVTLTDTNIIHKP